MEDTLRLALSDCFELGRALRIGDADSFCKVYDSLPIQNSKQDELKLSSIKEVARQISELDKEDYDSLKHHFHSFHTSDISIDICEPIAIQLSILVDNLQSEGLGGSDSGAVSDYDSSVCENTDAVSNNLIEIEKEHRTEEFNKVPEPCLEDYTSNKDEVLSEDMKSSELIPPSIGFSADGSNTRLVGGGNDGGVNTFGEFWSKIKDIDTKSEEGPAIHYRKTSSTPALSREESSEAIMVTDLEKEFFSTDSNPSEAPAQCKDRKSGTDTGERTDDQDSKTNTRNVNSEDRTTKASSYNNYHSTKSRQSNRKWRYRPNHRSGMRSNHRRDNEHKYKENNVNSSEPESHNGVLVLEGSNHIVKIKHEASVSHQQSPIDKQGPPLHHTSPLVLQSQNMWSSNSDVIKSSIKKTRKISRPAELFNHYEVGNFLFEGWKKVQRELASL